MLIPHRVFACDFGQNLLTKDHSVNFSLHFLKFFYQSNLQSCQLNIVEVAFLVQVLEIILSCFVNLLVLLCKLFLFMDGCFQ